MSCRPEQNLNSGHSLIAQARHLAAQNRDMRRAQRCHIQRQRKNVCPCICIFVRCTNDNRHTSCAVTDIFSACPHRTPPHPRFRRSSFHLHPPGHPVTFSSSITQGED